MRLLDRYLLREIALPFAIGIGLFFVVVAFGQVLQISDSVTGLGISGAEVLQALMYSMPPLMGLLIPASCLFSTLLAVGRMASDKEIVAMSAGGVSPYDLLRVPFWTGVVLSIVAAVFLVRGEPWGIQGLRELMSRSAQRALASGVRSGEFHQWVPGVTFLARGKQGDDLTEVVFADRRDEARPLVISARRGKILSAAAAKDLVFALSDGVVLVEDKDTGRYRVIHFEHSDYRLDVESLVGNKAVTLQPVQGESMEQLWQNAHDPQLKPGERALRMVVFNRKLALPLATIIFSLLAVPLACRTGGGARARGFLWSAAIIGGYYYVGRAAELSARGGRYDAVLAAWTPNLLGVLALIVLLPSLKRRAA